MDNGGENPNAATSAQLAFIEGIDGLKCPMCGQKEWIRADDKSGELGGLASVLPAALPGGTRPDVGVVVIAFVCANPLCKFVRLHKPPPKT
jgi:hypothetical protein